MYSADIDCFLLNYLFYGKNAYTTDLAINSFEETLHVNNTCYSVFNSPEKLLYTHIVSTYQKKYSNKNKHNYIIKIDGHDIYNLNYKDCKINIKRLEELIKNEGLEEISFDPKKGPNKCFFLLKSKQLLKTIKDREKTVNPKQFCKSTFDECLQIINNKETWAHMNDMVYASILRIGFIYSQNKKVMWNKTLEMFPTINEFTFYDLFERPKNLIRVFPKIITDKKANLKTDELMRLPIKINFVETIAPEVFEVLGEISKAEMAMTPDAFKLSEFKTVSLKFDGEKLQIAMDKITNHLGLDYKIDNSIIVVDTDENNMRMKYSLFGKHAYPIIRFYSDFIGYPSVDIVIKLSNKNKKCIPFAAAIIHNILGEKIGIIYLESLMESNKEFNKSTIQSIITYMTEIKKTEQL